MNVTFLIPPAIDGNPPAERSSGCTRVVYPMPNIYELTVAAVVEKAGFHVRYKDFVFKNHNKADLIRFLEQDDSDVYCLWTVNLSIENDSLVAQLIRDLRPNTKTFFIGPGPTFFIEKCLFDSHNIVVRGEPELIVVELLNALKNNVEWKNIKGISFRSEKQIVNNGFHEMIKDLDELPFPARHFTKEQIYRNPKLKLTPYTVMITSRNCPFKCIYCVPSSLTFAREIENRREFGKKPFISFRSEESIEKELRELYQEGYKAIGFMDDNFIWSEKRTLAICEMLCKYQFKWGCQARVDAINENIAKALGKSGCLYVDLGVESFDDEVLKYIKKGITQEQIYAAIGLLKKYNVPVKLNILIGTSPLETKKTLRETLRKAKALHVDQIMFNIVSPFPGTEFYSMAKKNGWIKTGEYIPTDVQKSSILNYPHLSAKEMEKILFWSNLSYFLSPRFIFTQLKRFSNIREFNSALKALKIKMFG